MSKFQAKKSRKKDTDSFIIDDFAFVENEIAANLLAKDELKVKSQQELNKLISQQAAAASWEVRRKYLIPKSPHVLNIQEKVIEKKRIEFERAILAAKVAKKNEYKHLYKKIISLYSNIINKSLAKIIQLKIWHIKRHKPVSQARSKLFFNFSNITELSLVKLLESIWRLLRLFFIAIIKVLLLAWHGLLFSLDEFIFRLKYWRLKLINISFKKVYQPGFEPLNMTINRVNKPWRRVLAFIIMAFFILSPYLILDVYKNAKLTQGKVMGISQEAAIQWQQGIGQLTSGDWQLASNSFQQAELTFNKAQQELQKYNQAVLDIASVLPFTGKEVTSGRNLLKIGQTMSSIVADISNIIDKSVGKDDLDLNQKLSVVAVQFSKIRKQYDEIGPLIDEVDVSILPDQYQSIFSMWQIHNQELRQWLINFDDTLNWLMAVMGEQQPRRYLLMFQNSNELRATGGFMGSYAVIDLNKGRLENLEMPGGGTYDLKGQQKRFVIGPYPHHLLGVRWNIWDANWWPDWSTAANKIAWFYESAGGSSVDGVFAINSSVIVSMVNLLGPIEMPEYDKLLTGDNIVLALQHAIEFEYDKDENKPKQILADLAPVLLDKIYNLSIDQALQLGLAISNHLDNKDIQLYFKDPKLEALPIAKGWDGQVKQVTGDYLQVIAQNIGGGKTDNVIKQTVSHKVTIGPDDYLIGTTTIKRQHNGDQADVFERHRNVSFIRIFVPAGSELITITGATPPDQKLFKEVLPNFEADEDLIRLDGLNYYQPFDKYYTAEQFDKQVFGQWLMIDPGQTAELTFIYRLPISLKEKTDSSFWDKLINRKKYLQYSFYLQKQPGLAEQNYVFSFKLPANLNIDWLKDNHDAIKSFSNLVYGEDNTATDWQFGLIAN